MYQAIVFLPLLGAILAGLISLVGARARHPGGEPAAGAHPHSTAPSHTGADEPHGEHLQPALGSRFAELITTGLLFFSMILSWIAFVRVGFGDDAHVSLTTWVASGDLKFAWALRVDTLTAVMLVVVTTISALVHLYSIGYMADDPHQPRFFSYLSLFTFAMLMLVTADNLVQLFFGWEGVGLMSYLIIGFWYLKPE
jgi:NADH-quinone oxidoreductase subunit L